MLALKTRQETGRQVFSKFGDADKLGQAVQVGGAWRVSIGLCRVPCFLGGRDQIWSSAPAADRHPRSQQPLRDTSCQLRVWSFRHVTCMTR